MKLVWETRYRYRPPETLQTQYWALTTNKGQTTGVDTGYLVVTSALHPGKFIAVPPDGNIRMFTTEAQARHYCEVCYRMGVHNDRGKAHR
mgnify:CR=1 FL=1